MTGVQQVNYRSYPLPPTPRGGGSAIFAKALGSLTLSVLDPPLPEATAAQILNLFRFATPGKKFATALSRALFVDDENSQLENCISFPSQSFMVYFTFNHFMSLSFHLRAFIFDTCLVCLYFVLNIKTSDSKHPNSLFPKSQETAD